PSRLAVSRSGCDPSLTASCAKYALHECTKPPCTSIVPCGCASSTSSRTGRFQPGIFAPTLPSGRRAHVNVVLRGSTCCRSATDAVTSLNVDPGGYKPRRGATRKGAPRPRPGDDGGGGYTGDAPRPAPS